MASKLNPEQMGELEEHIQLVIEEMAGVESNLGELAGTNDEAAVDMKEAFESIVETLQPWIETLAELSDVEIPDG